jgi:hypothetical protein
MPEELSQHALEYQSPISRRPKPVRIWPVVLAVPAPSLIQAAYITAAEYPARNWMANSEWFGGAAMGVAIAAGIALLAFARIPLKWLIPLAVLFGIAQFGWLIIFSFGFACSVFHECP